VPPPCPAECTLTEHASAQVLLLLQSSDRIAHDICEALPACCGFPCTDEPAVQPAPRPTLVLRQWRALTPGREFRCFVAKGELAGDHHLSLRGNDTELCWDVCSSNCRLYRQPLYPVYTSRGLCLTQEEAASTLARGHARHMMLGVLSVAKLQPRRASGLRVAWAYRHCSPNCSTG